MKEKRIREELMQFKEMMADCFQSGLSMAPAEMNERLQAAAGRASQFGMEWLAERFRELAEILERRRHTVTPEGDEELCTLFCRICRYLDEATEAAGMDEAGQRIRQKEWEQE